MADQRGGSFGDGDREEDGAQRTQDEMDTVEALLVLSGAQPSTQHQATRLPVPNNFQQTPQFPAAQPPPPSSSTDAVSSAYPLPPPTNVPGQGVVTLTEVQTQIEGPLVEFVRNTMMTTHFQTRHFRQAAIVATRFGGMNHLRNALIALDDADWDVGGAIQQHNFDVQDRQQNTNPQPPQLDGNRGLDRRRASGGANWDPSKLQLRMRVGKKWKHRDYTTVDPDFNTTDPSPTDILRLNRWRHAEITSKVGPRLPPRGGGNPGTWWHPVELRAIMQRFRSRMRSHPDAPRWEGMAQEHNNFFDGMYLPGELYEVPKRSDLQIIGALDRIYAKGGGEKRVQSNSKKREKQVEIIKKLERKDKKKAKKTAGQEFSSDEAMLLMVEMEELKIQWDTESDNDSDDDDYELDSSESSGEDSEDESQQESEQEPQEENSSPPASDIPYA